MKQDLLDILRCPDTGVPLIPLDPDTLSRLNVLIAARQILTCQGRVVVEPLAEALMAEDYRRVYRVQDGIPILLIEEEINTEPLAIPKE